MKHTKLHTIQAKETSGKATIALAKDTFTYIDSDFQAWGTNKKGEKTAEMNLEVYQMEENATFTQLFTEPEKMRLSQEQIIQFCTEHKDKLSPGWATFFLFKVDSDFFVADVYVNPVGLYVDVDQFSHDDVWSAESGDRFVIPQLTLKPSAPMTLSPSDTLTLESRVEKIEAWIENVRNQLL